MLTNFDTRIALNAILPFVLIHLILDIIHCLGFVLKRDVSEAGSVSFFRQEKIPNLCVCHPVVLIAIMKVSNTAEKTNLCYMSGNMLRSNMAIFRPIT